MNYLITLKYDGAGYHGWQRQSNAVSVQQRVEEALGKLFDSPITVSGCSRTDAGVHANCFKCNFHTEKVLPHKTVISGLNFFLPEDIAVFDSVEVDESFNARFSCKGKEYIYQIHNASVRDPFYRSRALFYRPALDENLMTREAAALIGTHDFTSFRAIGSNVTTTVRTVTHAYAEREGDLVTFHIQADGFLYNMVRIVVGTLLYISEGKIEPGSIPSILEAKVRTLAGKTVPPEGLYLNQVLY